MQGLIDTAEREFMATDCKSPSAPATDLARTRQRWPSSTPAVYRSFEDRTRMGRRSRAISVPFGEFATNPSTARTRRSSESDLESCPISTDAVRTEGNGEHGFKCTDGVRDGARGAKRQRVLSESDGDNESTNPPPPCRQDMDVSPDRLPLNSEDDGAVPAGIGLTISEAHQGDGQAQPPQCQYEGCTKPARLSGRMFCRRHGEGRRCKTPGCKKVDVGGGSCRRHGGGRRCGAEGCLKTDVGGGFCVSHGGGKRCRVEGCAKGAQAGGLFCKSHGGGRRCRIKGCMTSAQSGADMLCIKHGGGKRCIVPGCTKLVRKNNRCTKHASQAPEVVAPSAGASTTTATAASTTKVTAEGPTSTVGDPIGMAGESIKGHRLASSSFPLDSDRVVNVETPFVPQTQANRTVSVKPPSESGGIELDRALPPPLAASIADISSRTSYSGPPLPSMTSVSMVDKRSALHPEPKAVEGKADLRDPVVSFSGRCDPPPISPPFSLPSSGLTPSSIDDPAVLQPPVSAFGDKDKVKATGPMLQEPMRSSAGGMFPIVAPVARPPLETARGFQRPLPRLASIEPSFNRDRATFASGRVCNLAWGLAAAADNSTLPPHVATDGPVFPPGDNAPLEFSSRESGSDVGLHHVSGSSRFRDGGSGRSQLSTSLPPPPRPHSLQPPPPSSVDRAALTVPTFVAEIGSGGIGGGSVAADLLNASMWSNGASSTLADPSTPSAQGAFAATPPNYLSPAVAVASRRPTTPFPASPALDDNSGPADKPRLGTLPDDQPVAAQASEDAFPSAPPQPRCSEKTTPSAEDGGGDAAQGRSCFGFKGSVTGSERPRTRSSPTPSQSQTYISLSVRRMMCMESCGQMVQRALGEVTGVRSVTVHFPTRTASVQVEPEAKVSVPALITALEAIGFESDCIATSTSEEPTLEESGVNAVWAIASALGLVDRGCAMAWGHPCNCGKDCKCVNCPVHMKKVSHAVDLVLKAVDLSHSTNPASPAHGSTTSSD